MGHSFEKAVYFGSSEADEQLDILVGSEMISELFLRLQGINKNFWAQEEAKEEATEEWDFDPSSVRWLDVSQTEGGGRLNQATLLTDVTALDPLARCQILRRKKGPWKWVKWNVWGI